MTAPVGLTRAEEAAERQRAAPRVVVAAPPGVPHCRASVPPNGDDCKAEATILVEWRDGDKTPMCLDCTKNLQQQAPGSIRKVEPL